MNVNYQGGGAFGQLVQGFVFGATASLSLLLIASTTGTHLAKDYFVFGLIIFMMSFAVFRRFDLLGRWELGRLGSTGTRVYMSWIVTATPLLLVGLATQLLDFFNLGVLLAWLILTPIGFSLVHTFARYGLLRLFPRMVPERSAVIVFYSPSSEKLAQIVENLDSPRFNLLGFFEDRDDERTGRSDSGVPVLGKTNDLAEYVNHNTVQVVFVVLPPQGVERALNVVNSLGDTTASIYYVPDFRMFEFTLMRFGEVGGLPVLTLSETPFFGADGMLKRTMDILFSTAVLICLIPIFLLISVVIIATMGRPVFFAQHRYGLDGKKIKVYKFRSMRVTEDGEKITQATRDDPRVTPVGRFLRRTSLDELPQFWNVLTGQMSVVGPRPHAVAHNEQYRKLITRYMTRHKVKPGMTGLAQVNGLRGETRDIEDMEQRVRYDLEYIQRWSPELDMLIVLKTLWIIFQDHEVY